MANQWAISTNQARQQWPEFIAGPNKAWVKLRCNPASAVRVAIPAGAPFGQVYMAPVHPVAKEAFEALAAVMQHHGYLFRESSGGTYNCRKIGKGLKKLSSLHAHGIAIDLNPKKNPIGTTRTDMPRAFVDDVLAIRTRNGKPVWVWGMEFKDPMHFQITGSTRADVETGIDWSTVVGGDVDGVSSPAVENPTHRVTATVLNLRREPSERAEILGKLAQGSEVEQTADTPRQVGDHLWVKVRAAVRGDIREGWVAVSFLHPPNPTVTSTKPTKSKPDKPTHPTKPDPNKRAPDEATYRVTAGSGLNLRPAPSTSTIRIALLETGTVVVGLSDPPEEHEDFLWVRIRARVGDNEEMGWVAKQRPARGLAEESYLEDFSSEPVAPTPDAPRRRVTADSGLNLRPAPTTSTIRIALLETGTVVVELDDPPEEHEDYLWVRIRAQVGDHEEVGWVARGELQGGRMTQEFLEAID